MNFEILKQGFGAYLGFSNGGDAEAAAVQGGLSIFAHAGDFKNYIDKVLPESSAELSADVFLELIKEDKFKNAVDTDKSGKIDTNEMENFLEAVKGLDNNKNDISASDFLAAAELIKNDIFNIPDIEDNLAGSDLSEIALDMNDAALDSPFSLPLMSSTGKSPSSGAYNLNISAKNTSNMTEEELKKELQKAENNLQKKQEALRALYDGVNPNIKKLEDSVKDKYKNYQETLKAANEEYAARHEALQQKINSKQQELDAKASAVSEKETAVSNAQNSYKNAVSARENLESILNSLNSSNAEDKDSKISEVKTQLEAAKQAETAAKEALEKAEKELKQLKDEYKELKEGEEGLDKLKEQLQQTEAEKPEENPAVKQAEKEWKEAEKLYEQEKSAAISKAQQEVSRAQEKVNSAETAIADFQQNKAQTIYNSGYNAQAGSKLAAAARHTAGTKGRCLRGVNDTLQRIYGARIPRGSAYQAAEVLASNQGIGAHFKEIQVSRSDLSKLPAGAIVVWNNNAAGGGRNVSRAGRVHGHISIALGNGYESSDHIQKQIVNRDASFRVFAPNS